MMRSTKKILLLSYSFSGQTNGLLRSLSASLENQGHEVLREKLNPSSPLRFPVGSIPATFKIMITTFFRQRVAIEPLSEECRKLETAFGLNPSARAGLCVAIPPDPKENRGKKNKGRFFPKVVAG